MKRVIIVGGGLSGLAAALKIEQLGGKPILIEKASALGGRVRTDRVEGFLLDRGFQVLLTSYPAIRKMKVLKELSLKTFLSGAMCRIGNRWTPIYNPLHHPLRFLETLRHLPGPILLDLVRLARPLLSPFEQKGTTSELIAHLGISEVSRNAFLEPFFKGVFLEKDLSAMARLFQRYLRFFSVGHASLPERGMQQLPMSLASRLRRTEIMLKTTVKRLARGCAVLEDGSHVVGDAVIVALNNPAAAQLLPEVKSEKSVNTLCLYYKVPKGIFSPKPILYLGDGRAINNLSFPNTIQPSYAPTGYDLVSITIVDPDWQLSPDSESQVKKELQDWFGVDTEKMRLLRRYQIEHALPTQGTNPQRYKNPETSEANNLFLAGEATEDASINGALTSGIAAARAAMGTR